MLILQALVVLAIIAGGVGWLYGAARFYKGLRVGGMSARDYRIEVSFLPRATAVLDADLIRTKVSLIPESVQEIRVVDIVGLDKQADGGTHVRSTAEVGRVRITKIENKGKGNKRVRLVVEDA